MVVRAKTENYLHACAVWLDLCRRRCRYQCGSNAPDQEPYIVWGVHPRDVCNNHQRFRVESTRNLHRREEEISLLLKGGDRTAEMMTFRLCNTGLYTSCEYDPTDQVE